MVEQLIEFEVNQCTNSRSYCSNDIIIILNLEQDMRVKSGSYKTQLSVNDIILFNTKTAFTLESESALYVCYTIHMKTFLDMFSGRRYHFLCDSTKEINDNYDKLRRYLTELLVVQYEGQEYQRVEHYRISCELLIFLVNSFSVMYFAAEVNEKFEEIVEYIDEHFQEDLSLNQVSERYHMTAPYFSKYFKKNMGITFLRYLNRIRLKNAVEDLMSSQKNLLHIAIDSGFPNAESFHRNFVEVYHQTPQEFRKQHFRQNKENALIQRENLKRAVSCLGEIEDADVITDIAELDVSKKQSYLPFWSEMINLNDSSLLSNYEAREQFKSLQKELAFRYVRINLNWDQYEQSGVYSFYLEEQTFDFLMENQLHLWFSISMRAVSDMKILTEYVKRLLSHFMNRYDANRVREWRFELCYNTMFDEQKAHAYWFLYDKLNAVLKEFHIKSELLGAGIELGNWKGMKTFEKYMEEQKRSLSIQTMEVEPYICVEAGEGLTLNRATDSSYVKNQIKMLRKIFLDYLHNEKEIYITSWSDSITKLNILNDSCYRGATIIKNIIDCFGQVGVFAYSVPLDLAYKDKMQDKVIFGGDGLLSKQGLKKPSFYAYRFLQRVGRYYYGKTENSIIFGNDDNEYQIICHNCKGLSYHYYMEEEQLNYEHFETYFENDDALQLRFRLTHLKNGSYTMKIRSVSREYGSIQDEFRKMAPFESIVIPEYLHSDDLEYLHQVNVPHMRLQTFCVTDGMLDLHVELKPNEFAHMEIVYSF